MVRGGILITFSGLDGAGKSTQIELLEQRLAVDGWRPVVLWTRVGYTGLFNVLKKGLRFMVGERIPPPGKSVSRNRLFARPWVTRIWLAAALLDLIRVYGVQVRFWRLCGRSVLCDRYLWDSLLDFRVNFPNENVEKGWLWKLLVRVTPQPDVRFLLLVSVEESARRSNLKDEPFPDPPDVLSQRSNLYQILASEGSWQLLDGIKAPADLFSEVLAILDESIPHFRVKP